MGEALVEFDASASTDADGNIVRYEWDFDYSWMKFNPMDTGVLADHVFTAAGNHTVALRVTDNEGKTCIIADTTVYTAVAAISSNVVACKGFALSVFPNPSRGRVTVEAFTSGSDVSISIYNVAGKCLNRVRSDRLEWDTKGAAPGVYIVRVLAQGKLLARKIVLQ